MITHIFFDLGSTLYDESVCIKTRIEAALGQPGAPEREIFMKKVREYAAISPKPVNDAAKELGLDIPHWDSSLERIYPDAFGVLEELSRRYSLGVIANQSAGAESRMEARGIRKYFDTVVLSAESGLAKPDPKIFRLALECAGCRAENAAIVGDRLDNDITPAKRLGMKTVWLRQGMFSDSFRAAASRDADHTVHSLSELLGIF